MIMRTWEIRENKFNLLVKHLGFTSRMVEALKLRYHDNHRSRSSVAGKFNLTEHGIMKAEKQLLAAHKEFSEVYCGSDN
ncbi:hypothetical protein NVP1072O_04 [Vibrio phage 1.072.O._10N.286.48.A12]|nr:hypothetical protein NVP1004O_02 [Vibrio phage 1.004.O._10N.261.54.A2]AUR83563.1 hypothetical protein NVP1037O_03 [Vibrio phage 1.037.O._10N.261.52.F7]AUR84446.1 hypothetical protein NVP1056O_04 [Vibrio phage 1.056.O._10N.261.48.C11]AUR84963.1 hypothetical protein NVP1066O_04 [Vibrio phage 1.066.O._10N.286.46.E8]AUR85094.1 hypothetical protein NVP1068O_04 [Vibrio phage 1.068.O._10N.261.51.F8]AUR85321.1 hypothetical protein NVP1072O_04 [Vibrio phage 1.072.O._10N.286.48.A12]